MYSICLLNKRWWRRGSNAQVVPAAPCRHHMILLLKTLVYMHHFLNIIDNTHINGKLK